MKRLSEIFKFSKKDKELAMIKSDLKNTEALIDLLRQQGHDHINHIQTVTSMLILEEVEVAKEYLQGIANNYRFTGHFLRLGNPSLTALVNTKKELANQKGIEFIVEKYCRVNLKNITPWDIASIIGNLLENAIEYILTHNHLPQRIYFHLEHREKLDGYIFKITNPYEENGENVDDFFTQGVSTKASSGRGYGLSIVKDLVEQYKGKIQVYKNGDNITFEVELRD
ncbi:sensor kinase SpoOB-type protein [Natranaerovirga pectinivora]|uniref:Sensor kinase SpoOB-type protein n=1 Tax=Natranaerovirga pectinivora TaxID=682400 RepID=A0A4R3ML99_9FIRM|nr:GHKL domain-containing protein [Natranaerovirga pectinivora]TCT15398.1 sensor kinase SpoOB-type protein [Natranaerovirga pectinivora]